MRIILTLKTQCYYKLADLINKGQIGISTNDIRFKEAMIQELEQVRRVNIDKDTKLAIMSKDKIKALIVSHYHYKTLLYYSEHCKYSALQPLYSIGLHTSKKYLV